MGNRHTENPEYTRDSPVVGVRIKDERTRERWKQHAKKRGQSLNAMIRDAVEEMIEGEK